MFGQRKMTSGGEGHGIRYSGFCFLEANFHHIPCQRNKNRKRSETTGPITSVKAKSVVTAHCQKELKTFTCIFTSSSLIKDSFSHAEQIAEVCAQATRVRSRSVFLITILYSHAFYFHLKEVTPRRSWLCKSRLLKRTLLRQCAA